MKRTVILMALILATSTAVLANPIFEDRGTEANNPLIEGEAAPGHNGGVDILGMGAEKLASAEDTTKPHSKYKAEIYVLKFGVNYSDPDSDGDGIGDFVLESKEQFDTNRGQVVSALTSERKKPKFKAGAELSKAVNSMYVGDLDGDGFGDLAISIRQEETRNKDTYRVAATSTEDWRIPAKVEVMDRGGLIEAMAASSPKLSTTELEMVLDSVGEIILGEDRDMVMPGDR